MLREFRSHPEVAAEFHELHEENIRFIASYVQKTFNAGQYFLLNFSAIDSI